MRRGRGGLEAQVGAVIMSNSALIRMTGCHVLRLGLFVVDRITRWLLGAGNLRQVAFFRRRHTRTDMVETINTSLHHI
jgi:hypothetical protein